jgi:phospholipase C
MQENRSFDHYFGTMSGVRGFGYPLRPSRESIPAFSAFRSG